MTISAITFAIIAILLVLLFSIIRVAWNSPLFWLAAFIVTVITWPITAGASWLGLIALVGLRVVLLSKIFKPSV